MSKKFTDKQFEILLSSARVDRYEAAVNHYNGEYDGSHEMHLIPIFKAQEHRSARAMEERGWGYITVCAPHEHYFFRPVKGLRYEAVQQVRALPNYHPLKRLA